MNIEKTYKKVTFEEAEEEMILYYAFLNWENAVMNAEQMRRRIWTSKLGIYPSKIEAIGKVRNIKDEEYA